MPEAAWVCSLSGRCSGIRGEASYRGKSLNLAERGRNQHKFFKINDDHDDVHDLSDVKYSNLSSGQQVGLPYCGYH